ncbi:MAG TPA: hypothetical protein VK675_03330 [Candidatus Paceibacterota bacterium]|nr:hypothetical protein [Candidatus Paceibacterota bacterium]
MQYYIPLLTFPENSINILVLKVQKQIIIINEEKFREAVNAMTGQAEKDSGRE